MTDQTKKQVVPATAAKKSKKGKKANSARSAAKNRKDREDSPIAIGGGSGLVKRLTIGGMTVTFDRSKYVQDSNNRRRWSYVGHSITGLTIIDEGGPVVPPVLKPNSKIAINCVDTRGGGQTRYPIKIYSNPIGIEFPPEGHFVDYGTHFGCLYLGIKEIPIDDEQVNSRRGRCLFKAHSS